MRTIFSEDHKYQDGTAELIDGQFHPPVEKPERADRILAAVNDAGIGEVAAPDPVERDLLERVHDPDYLRFLETAWDEWITAHGDWDALPIAWPTRTFVQRLPEAIDGKLSYYSFDAGTPVTSGTWRAATAAAGVAATGARAVAGGERSIFCLCRPPGHHAGRDIYGGYCFLNNAAIAAEELLAGGAARLAIVDVDYHHGNGTQSIFYQRGDVLFTSIHADPRQDFPFFLGYDDETGEGEGEGANANFPLRWGTGWADGYAGALDAALDRVRQYAPDAVVVSLGTDTFDGDPISRFKLRSDDYLRIGEELGKLGLPTVFIMEGGYAVDALGVNVVNVLSGFEGA